MTMDTSVLVRARTEGGITARPVSSARADLNTGIPPSVSDLVALPEISTSEPEELGEAPAYLDARMSSNVAALIVLPHGTEEDPRAFSLEGRSSVEGVAGFKPTRPRRRPHVALANLAQEINPDGTAQPSEIIGIMSVFSDENAKVQLWVNELRAATGDDLHLVIMDFTGFEIPWELLTLPEGESGAETYLGAAVSTARWEDAQDTKTWKYHPEQWANEELDGHVAAFVDEEELERGDKEKLVLTELHATLETSLKELESRLERPETGFSLVYLACHCQAADTPYRYALGSRAAGGYRLSLATLHGRKLRLFKQSKAIVFINACHSGRMLRDTEVLDSEYLRGFPNLFLRKGAAGVIGTTGLVNDTCAADMADWFLHELSAAQEPVSKLLRRWREKVLLELPPDCSEEEDYVPLLNACMYVYYGNPHSRLRIRRGSS